MLLLGNAGNVKIIANVVILILFTVIYSVYSRYYNDYWVFSSNGSNGSNSDSPPDATSHLLDSAYACVTVHTTTGFGSFPKHFVGKLLIIIHLLITFFVNLVF